MDDSKFEDELTPWHNDPSQQLFKTPVPIDSRLRHDRETGHSRSLDTKEVLPELAALLLNNEEVVNEGAVFGQRFHLR